MAASQRISSGRILCTWVEIGFPAAGDELRAIEAVGNAIDADGVAPNRCEVEMAEPLEVIPFPAPELRRAPIQELLGLADVFLVLILGQVDAVDVELSLESLGLLPSLVGLELGSAPLRFGEGALAFGPLVGPT